MCILFMLSRFSGNFDDNSKNRVVAAQDKVWEIQRYSVPFYVAFKLGNYLGNEQISFLFLHKTLLLLL